MRNKQLLDVLLLFSGWLVKFFNVCYEMYENTYQHMKITAFNNKLVYYALYDKKDLTYNLMYDYDNFLDIARCYLFGGKSLNPQDISYALKKDMIVICQYVKKSRVYNVIVDSKGYSKKPEKKTKFLYVQFCGHDLTKEFNKFSDSFSLGNEIRALDYGNMLYKHVTGCYPPKECTMKLMLDDEEYFEQVFSSANEEDLFIRI